MFSTLIFCSILNVNYLYYLAILLEFSIQMREERVVGHFLFLYLTWEILYLCCNEVFVYA